MPSTSTAGASAPTDTTTPTLGSSPGPVDERKLQVPSLAVGSPRQLGSVTDDHSSRAVGSPHRLGRVSRDHGRRHRNDIATSPLAVGTSPRHQVSREVGHPPRSEHARAVDHGSRAGRSHEVGSRPRVGTSVRSHSDRRKSSSDDNTRRQSSHHRSSDTSTSSPPPHGATAIYEPLGPPSDDELRRVKESRLFNCVTDEDSGLIRSSVRAGFTPSARDSEAASTSDGSASLTRGACPLHLRG